jgi:hypothetical protein
MLKSTRNCLSGICIPFYHLTPTHYHICLPRSSNLSYLTSKSAQAEGKIATVHSCVINQLQQREFSNERLYFVMLDGKRRCFFLYLNNMASQYYFSICQKILAGSRSVIGVYLFVIFIKCWSRIISIIQCAKFFLGSVMHWNIFPSRFNLHLAPLHPICKILNICFPCFHNKRLE